MADRASQGSRRPAQPRCDQRPHHARRRRQSHDPRPRRACVAAFSFRAHAQPSARAHRRGNAHPPKGRRSAQRAEGRGQPAPKRSPRARHKSMNAPLYIVDGARTPFSKMGTDLAATDAVELGRTAAAAVLARTGLDPAQIDEVIFGCVGQPIDAANPGRVIALRAGVPSSVPAITVHRNCASGFEAITQAAEKIAAGRGHIFLVGGTESMTRYPLLYNESATRNDWAMWKGVPPLQKAAAIFKCRPQDFNPRISLQLGLTDPVCGVNMGQTAETLARDWRISREDQDQFALQSHQRAAAAKARFSEETWPVYPRGGRKPGAVTDDNGVREQQTMDALAKLRPVFEKR